MKSNLNNLAQLKVQYPNQHIPYQELLGTQEWKFKRDAIVERDKGRCIKCGTKPTELTWHIGKAYNLYFDSTDGEDISEVAEPVVLHVHHLYYVLSKHPWEYEDKALATLCNRCHAEVHKTETIRFFYDLYGAIQIRLQPLPEIVEIRAFKGASNHFRGPTGSARV